MHLFKNVLNTAIYMPETQTVKEKCELKIQFEMIIFVKLFLSRYVVVYEFNKEILCKPTSSIVEMSH